MVLKTWPNSTSRPFGLALTALSVGIIAWGTLTSASSDGSAPPSWCFLCAGVHATDVLFNVLLFIPLGIGLRLAGASRRRVLAISAVITLAVELAQWFYVSGRIASIADLVANVVGAAAGMLLAERSDKLVFPEAAAARLLARTSLIGWLVVQLGTAWEFGPSFRPAHFWWQLAADLGHLDRFTGEVIAASVGEVPVPNGPTRNTELIRGLFDAGRHVEARVVPGDPTAGLAPIVSIFDHGQREIMLLGQEGVDLVFRLRTHATDARLRTPTVSVWGAFPPRAATGNGPPPDTLLISGWRSGWRIHTSFTSRDTSATRSIALRPSFGWALVLPFEHTVTPLSWRFTAVWMAVLLFPAGYWGARSSLPVHEGKGRESELTAVFRNVTMLAFTAIVLSAGLIALPLWLGLAAAGVWEWGGALGGIAAGMVAGFLGYRLSHSRVRRSPG
ncbi:MAG: VanZ family protein [Gemmatimonadaceae bacterium]